MAKKTVDISQYLNTEKPEISIFGKTYTVDNDKKTVLLLNKLQEKGGDDADEKIISLLIGKEKGKEILEIMNEQPNFADNSQVIMLNLISLASGESYEDLLERFQHAREEILNK